MAKAVAKPKKIAAKSKPSAAVRAKPAAASSARKALRKSPVKPAKTVVAGKPAAESVKSSKWVYTFGDGKAEGKAGLRDLLGGKGANLAEMANLGLPVPPGFTIPTSVCTYFYAHDKTYPKELKAQVEKALDHVGKLTGKSFGDSKNPLLVSVRSGGRASLLGIPKDPVTFDLVNDVIFKGATVQGIYGRKMFETWVQMTELMKHHRLNLEPLFKERVPLDKFEQAFSLLESGLAGKILFYPNGANK